MARKPDPEERTPENEVAFMENPMRWPRLDLPMKRHVQGGMPETGIYLGENQDGKHRIWLCNIMELNEKVTPGTAVTYATLLDGVPAEVYDSAWDAVDNGWVCD